MLDKRESRTRRKKGIRKHVTGTLAMPRLTVYRSNNHIYAQIINDQSGTTIVSSNDIKLTKGKPVERAKEVGMALAKLAQAQNINKVVFDRNGYKYHGRVKSVADGAREGGLEF
jgi:large subunit ribosomal protein L18